MQTNIIIFGTLSSGLAAIHNSGGHFTYSLKYFWRSKYTVYPVHTPSPSPHNIREQHLFDFNLV